MPHRKPSWTHVCFRASVVLACTALLIGMAGVLHFNARDQRLQARHPADLSLVQVRGLRDPAHVDVVARWQDRDGVAHEEGGEVADDPWTWVFERAPEGIPLTLIVYRQGAAGRSEIARQLVILTRGATFEAYVRPARQPDPR
jgi:hypothetical protein